MLLRDMQAALADALSMHGVDAPLPPIVSNGLTPARPRACFLECPLWVRNGHSASALRQKRSFQRDLSAPYVMECLRPWPVGDGGGA